MTERFRLFLPVYLPTFLLAFGQCMLGPTQPLYALTFNDSFALASLVVSAAGIGTVLADVPSGVLLDRIGRRRSMMIGTVSIALCTVGLALATSYWLLLAFRLIAGVGTALWNISRMAYLAESTAPQARGRAISTFGGISRFGTFAGPAARGLLGTFFGLQAPFYRTAALAFAAAMVSFFYIRESGPVARKPKQLRWAILVELARSHWRG